MALATAERRSEDAVSAFSDIVNSTFQAPTAVTHTIYHNRDDDSMSSISMTSSDDLPPLVPINTPVYDYFGVSAQDDGVKLIITEDEKPVVEKQSGHDDKKAGVNEEEEVDETEEEEVEEVEEQSEEEEEQELELVPVRIKKVTYWKDETTGDIYQYLPDDECGDKVGMYVDGKAVFI